jgi:hypothetical protein
MVFRHSIAGVLALCIIGYARPTYAATDPCSLLTPAQVSAVLGVNVGAGKTLASTICDWTSPNQAPGVAAKKVTLTLQKPQAFAYAKMPVNSKEITKTPVSGIGDDAVYGTTGGKYSSLTVKKGDVVFAVHVFGFPLDQQEDKEKTLAKEIVGKL